MSTVALVEVFRGDSQGLPSVNDFFKQLESAAALGRWDNDLEKIRVLHLKVKGSAALFVNTHPDICKSETTYETIKSLMIERFTPKELDRFYYIELQTAVQGKNETPEQFADRVCKLGSRTIRITSDAREQKILNDELERRLESVFSAGLRGVVGEQVRFRMPKTMEEAVKLAVMVASAVRANHGGSSSDSKPVFSVNKSSPTCYRCNKQGHRSENCYARANTNNYRVNHSSNYSPNNGNNNNNKNNYYRVNNSGNVNKNNGNGNPGNFNNKINSGNNRPENMNKLEARKEIKCFRC